MRLLLIVATIGLSVFGIAGSSNPRAALLSQVGGQKAPPPHDLFYPICLFVEEGASPSIKELRNSLIEEAEKCQVTLIVQSLPVGNLPPHSNQLAMAAERYCDADQRFGRMVGPNGLFRASVAVVTKRQGAAAEFCNISAAQAAAEPSGYFGGCGQYGKEPKFKNNLEYTFGYAAKLDDRKATVAIVDSGKRTFADLQRTLMGVGMMGLPPGSGAGNGLGLPDEAAPLTAQYPNSLAWTNAPNGGGCEQMRRAALPNPKRLRASYQLADTPALKGVDIQRLRSSPSVPPKSTAGTLGGKGDPAPNNSTPPINKGQNTVDLPSGTDGGAESIGVTVRGGSRRNTGDDGKVVGAKGEAPTRASIQSRANQNLYEAAGGEVAVGKGPNQASGEDTPMGGHGQNLGVGSKPPPSSVSSAPASGTPSAQTAPSTARTPTSDSDFFKPQPATPDPATPAASRHGTSTRSRN
jgi:hypothetical protein